jgi:PAS domain S-box-containing protein
MAIPSDSLNVSERRPIEDQLREAEGQFRTLVEQATDGIFIAGMDGRYQDVNPAGCAMLGYSRDELLGLSMSDILAPEETARLGGEVERLLGGSTVRSEWRFRRKDGSCFFGEVSGRRLPDSRLLGFLRDISERKHVEERLRESEARYRLIVENQTEFIVKWLPDCTRTFVNEHYCRLFGLTEEECIGTSFLSLVAPEHHGEIHQRVASLTPDHAEFTEEHVSYTHAGPRWQQWTTRGIFDARGRVVEILSTGRDITERKEAEAKLLQSQTHLLASQRIAGVGSWEMDITSVDDLARNPIRWSAECHRLLGNGPDDDVEMSSGAFYSRVHPDDRQRVRDAFRHAVDQGSRYSIEHRILLEDGAERILHQQAEQVLDPITGVPVKFIGTTQDITDRVRLEEQLRQSQKMQAIGQLAGGVAHDFNNLLTVINGYSDMLLMDRDEADPSRHELAAIRDAGERAAQLTRQLLLFSRKAVFEPRELDVNDLVQRVGVMLRRLISEDIELQLTLAPSPPAIKADPIQLEQMVINLALNGRDAMERGGRLSIATSVGAFDEAFCHAHPEYRPGRFVHLTVEDTGCGMTPHTKAHLFEPFFTTKGPKGTGLGLATVYGIVQESSGFITVASDVGAGTTMNVFLPSLDKPALRRPTPAVESDVLEGTETVLLVEDEDAVRGVATLALTLRGYRVMAAGSGPAALRLLELVHDPVHLLVTDVVMPEMSGGQLAETIRSRFPSCRILFMSGYNEDMAVRHGQLGRNDAFLQKPFTPLSLARKVREILDQSR